MRGSRHHDTSRDRTLMRGVALSSVAQRARALSSTSLGELHLLRRLVGCRSRISYSSPASRCDHRGRHAGSRVRDQRQWLRCAHNQSVMTFRPHPSQQRRGHPRHSCPRLQRHRGHTRSSSQLDALRWQCRPCGARKAQRQRTSSSRPDEIDLELRRHRTVASDAYRDCTGA